MKEFFKQYAPYYKNYKLQFFYSFIGIILVSSATAGTAYIIQPLLDDIFINKDKEMLYMMPIFVIILYGSKGFGRYIQAYYISFIGQDITRIVRDKLFSHVLNLDIDFENSYAYSDSLTDLPMLNLVKNKYQVIYKNKKAVLKKL